MRTTRALALIFSASLALAPATARGQIRGGPGFMGGFGGSGGGFGGGGFGGGGFGGGGFGLGYGFGIFPYYYSPALPEPLLYRQALQQGSRATMGPVTHDVYRNNPASYVYHLRDSRYLGTMSAEERRRIEAQVGRYTDGPPPRARTASRRAAQAEVHPTPQAAPVNALRQDPRRRVE